MLWLKLISAWTLFQTVYSQCSYQYNSASTSLIYSCENVTKSNYLYYMDLLGPQIQKEVGSSSALNVKIQFSNSQFPELGNWITLPMSNNNFWVNSKIFFNFSNCGINSIDRNTFVFSSSSYAAPDLDLSFNNISNVDFLSEMLELERIYLRNSTTSFNIFKSYLSQFYCNEAVKYIDLSYTDITTVDFTGFTCFPEINFSGSYVNSVTGPVTLPALTYMNMNLSDCENLEYIKENSQTRYIEFNYLDLSNINNFKLFSFQGVRVHKLLNFSNTNLRSLYSNFDIVSGLIDRPVLDLSYASLGYIASEYFSGAQLQSLNLTGNNLTELSRQIFSKANIPLIDLSNSNIIEIGWYCFESLISDKLILAFNKIRIMNTPFQGGSIQQIILSKNNISSLENVFNRTVVVSLDLSFNPIETIGSSTFENCIGLTELDLSGTHIRTIADNTFQTLTTLQSLKISFDGDFSAEALASMYLKSLEITHSHISTLKDGNFYGLFNLEELIFTNSEIDTVSKGALKYLVNVKKLDASSILKNIHLIPAGFFKDLVALTYLDLSSLDFVGFEAGAFDGLDNIEVLNITGSTLESDFKAIARLVKP